MGGGESALSPLSLCPCREDHPDQSPNGWAVTQNEGNWVQADPQSHGTWMGENVQRSGWPMCSTLWNGDLLHWKGGNWSHVGPLAASMLMCLAREKPVTWRSESRPLSLWGSVWGAQLSEHHSKADPKQVFLNLDPSDPILHLPHPPFPRPCGSWLGWRTFTSMPPWARWRRA